MAPCFVGSERRAARPHSQVCYAGVRSFHGTPVTNPQKNFTAGNPIRVSIQNGYADSLTSAQQIAQVQVGTNENTWLGIKCLICSVPCYMPYMDVND